MIMEKKLYIHGVRVWKLPYVSHIPVVLGRLCMPLIGQKRFKLKSLGTFEPMWEKVCW